MTWTPRQIAMLAEMGLHVPASIARPPVAAVSTPGPAIERTTESAVEKVTESASRRSVIDRSPPALTKPQPQPGSIPLPTTPPRIEQVPVPVQAECATSDLPGRTAYADLDWPELRATAAGCTACGLCAGRTRSVFGTGSQQAHWMVVGDPPGEEEDLRGEPFVGKSGQLLDNMLAALGLGRSEQGTDGTGAGESPSPATRVYIADTVKCRPPGNRNPTPVELAACEPYLVRQVELLKPKIILAMGRFAVQQLLRTDEPIGRLRGRVHHWQGVPLIVTYHPAYLLRNPVDKARAWDDLCLARETHAALG